jgi:hypothetical protein
MTTQGTLPRGRSATRFAVLGGLALLIIAACASAFLMLVWDPAAAPALNTGSVVVSSRSGQVQRDQPRRVEKSGHELGPKGPVFFDPSASEPRATINDQ